MLPLFVACADKSTPSETSDTAADSVPSDSVLNEINAELLDNFVIVYPEKCSDSVYDAIIELNKAIRSKFGNKLDVKDDFVREGTKFVESEYEILVGSTNRDETETAFSSVKKVNDYQIGIFGKKLVVGGISDSATVIAVRELIRIIGESPENVLFSADKAVRYAGTYALDELLLFGESISEYTIVYQGKSVCESLAKGICDAVLNRTGYIMRIEKASASVPIGKCIFIGQTGAPLPPEISDKDFKNSYYVGRFNDDFYLYAVDPVSATEAAQVFTELVKVSEGSLTLEEGVFETEDSSISVMSFNVLCNKLENRVESVFYTIRKYSPDTFGVQEATDEWIQKLSAEFAGEYAYIGVGRESNKKGEHSAIFYRTDRLTLVESGTKWLSKTPDVAGSKMSGAIYARIFTYGVFETKDTHERFIHVNTHTDHVGDGDEVRLNQVKVITDFLTANYSDMPAIISGDMNDTKEQKSIRHILNSGFEDSSDIALSADSSPTFSAKVIDYLFVTRGDFEVYEYRVDTEKFNGEYASDHRAIVIRFDIK